MEHARVQRRRPACVRRRPEFHQLAIFLKVTETRSFTATARQLGCTQPAISQAISRLEDLYGGDLFERRRGAPLALSPIGEAILPSARTLLHTVDEQMARATETARSRSGTLNLGFCHGLATGSLRAGIAAFVAACSGVRLQLVEDSANALRHALVERALDLIVVRWMPELADSSLTQERLWDEPLHLAIPANHPLALHEQLDWADLGSIPILVSAADPNGYASEAAPEHFGGTRPNFERHAVSQEALLDMVGMGMGGAIAFSAAAAPHVGVVFRRMRDEHASIAIDGIWRRQDANPLRHQLLRHIRARRGEISRTTLTLAHPTAPAPDHG